MLRVRRRGESGQVLIFFAVLAPVLFAILGLAVEGGIAFSEYRHMQAAADVAALVGAQDLPNSSLAATDACLFSQNNGYDDCSTGGTSTTTVCVPPQSISPYDGINYQEGNTPCANTGSNNYIEVQIQKPMQLFPIFSQYLGIGSFTLSTHAIARHGTPTKEDYAITILDHTASPDLTLTGNVGLVVVGPVISNSNATNSISATGSSLQVACNGQWLVSGPELYPWLPNSPAPNLKSLTGGTAAFAPTQCPPPSGSPCTYDCKTAFSPNQPPVPDPYCTSLSPPITGFSSTTGAASYCDSATNSVSSMSNCAPCNSTAWYYTWTTDRSKGTWQQAPSNGLSLGNANFELFPGIYPGGISANGSSKASVYLNPGVYTIEGGITAHGGKFCVFGAPACDIGGVDPNAPLTIPGYQANCSNADMTKMSETNYVPPSTWYYYCSPWGTWDANPCLGYTGTSACTPTNGVCPADTTHCRPSSLDGSANVPTFMGSGHVPLNGVTLYFPAQSSNAVDINGNNFMYLTFPNPCPGTGTQSGQTIPFQNEVNPSATGPGQTGWPEPSGAKGGQFTYPSTAMPSFDAVKAGQSLPVTSSWAGLASGAYVYPDADLTLTGECERYTPSTYAGDVWQGEMPTSGNYQGQHLHFLIFDRNTNSPTTLNGGGQQSFFGILYAPGSQGCGNCLMTLNGSSSGGGGPPFVMGQIIADTAQFKGTATVEVFYRPCDPKIRPCGSGPGSGLVE